MTLDFVLSNDIYVAEFEATGDFNLHIERDTASPIVLYQKSAGEDFALAKVINAVDAPSVFDCDFAALVYPKTIRVQSPIAVNVGEVTFNV